MDILLEPIKESLITLPLLLLACLFIEYLTSRNVANKVMEHGKLGPIVGAIVGCIPQCGFSVLAARFYTMNIITAGTLLSVFIATSDEALSILAIHPELWKTMILLIIVKIAVGAIAGLLVDKHNHKNDDDYEYIQVADCDCGCQNGIFVPAIKHALKIFAFILLTNIALSLLIDYVGQDTLTAFLETNKYLQPLASGIVGFIPNCAGSVVLTQLYVSGGLTFGALITGLSTSAGVGTLALITYNEDRQDTIRILLLSYIVALVIGYLLTFIL